MAESSESERDGLNTMGNPQIEYRSEEGGMPGTGYIGQVRPTGIIATGMADSSLWNSRTGAWKSGGSRELSRKSGRK